MSNPYRSPLQPSPLPPSPVPSPTKFPSGLRPPVIAWYLAFLTLMCVVYLLAIVFGILVCLFASEIADKRSDEPWIILQGVLTSVVSLPILGIYVFGFFAPRSKFGWVWGIVLIGIGLSTACCLPLTIPLLIFWLKEDNKAWHQVPL